MRLLLAATVGAVTAGCAHALPAAASLAGLVVALGLLLFQAPPGARQSAVVAVLLGLGYGADEVDALAEAGGLGDAGAP